VTAATSAGPVDSVVHMARPTALGPDRTAAAVDDLPGWSLVDGKLHAELRFADFAAAFGFMSAVATEAARLDHHPEWSNVYSTVVVDLVTHDAGGITDLDLTLAHRMIELAGTATWS
jgi:4a-hydroxytetrahydrobiopterin dehydratase